MTAPRAARAALLLGRDEFRNQVFERDGHRCVICHEPAQDAHHILERRLFDSGGYYLDNGASLCGDHHLEAERTLLSADTIRAAAGIERILLPPQLYDDTRYDKWGNVLLGNGRRLRGELFWDHSVQAILREAGVLGFFESYVKYPRTYHLPWSLSITKDDRVLRDVSHFVGKRVVVTEKMDGENTTMYQDYLHARSTEGHHYLWQDWVRNLQSRVGYQLPDDWRICGENVFAEHAIPYSELPGYFLLFAMYNNRDRCLSWADTMEYAGVLDLPTVPVLYEGIWDEEAIRACYTGHSKYNPNAQEGYVVRLADEFPMSRFRHSVAKFVRAGHVPNHGGHWRNKVLVANRLAA